MGRETQAYQLNTYLTNRIHDGYKVLVRNKPTDVDDARMERILTTITQLPHESYYVVGCGLGDILVNIKRIKKSAVVSGCEVSDIFRSFGQNLFNLHGANVQFEIKEPPYHKLPIAALMISIDYLGENPESIEVFEDMLGQSRQVVLFEPYPVRKYLADYSAKKFEVRHEEDYTVYTRTEERKVPDTFVLGQDVFGVGSFACSGALENPMSQRFNETYAEFHERVYGNKPGLSGC